MPIVIIDAGHGGVDGGAVSESGVVEKDVNLKIAKNLESYLSISGIKCIMTRTEDVELEPSNAFSSSRKRRDLLGRIEIANTNEDAIFISIHQNTYPSSRLSGLQVFYSKNNDNSKALADIIKNNNTLLIDSKNKRETKLAGKEILVLDSINNPAVLIECGFLSNAKEAFLLSDDEYQKKLAFMIFTSINEYIKNNFS